MDLIWSVQFDSIIQMFYQLFLHRFVFQQSVGEPQSLYFLTVIIIVH